MNPELRIGRALGALILVQMALGIWINFALLDPVFEAPGFLHNAALHPMRMGVAALIGLAGSALGLLAMSLFWPFANRSSALLARIYAALVVSSFVLTALEQASSLSMLSLSQQFQQAAVGQEPLYQALRGVVAEQRNWVHYLDKLVGGAGLLVFHLLLFKGAWIPRWLSGIGVVATLLQMSSVARPLLGADVQMELLAPLAFTQLALALWLIARGLREPKTAHASPALRAPNQGAH